MQPKNNVWNIIAFFVCSAVVLAGWAILQTYLRPPETPAVPEALILRNIDPKARPALISELLLMQATPSPVPGAGDAVQLGANALQAQYLAKNNFKLPALTKAEPK